MNWKSELKKCLLNENRKYMIENYVFEKQLWQKQTELLDLIIDKQYAIVTKSRNVGFTSLMAAYVACEMALNGDGVNNRDFKIRYIAPNYNMGTYFMRMVINYLKTIPTSLHIITDYITECKNNKVRYDKAVLHIQIDKTCIENQDSFYNITIYDEPVAGKIKEEQNVYDIINVLRLTSSKVIVGGCPNHKVPSWYNVVLDAKRDGNYMILPWETNDTQKKTLEEMKYEYRDIDDFQEELNCKVWRERTVKDYV